SNIVASTIVAERRVRRLQRLPLIVSSSSRRGPRALDVGRACRRPFLDDGGERVEAVGQRRRPRLQDERRLDLAHKVIAHGGNVGETRPRRDLGWHEFLAAPGADDDVGLGGDQLVGGYDAVLGVLAPGERRKHILAAGDFDELGDPADAGDHRLVPLLEKYPGTAPQRGRPPPPFRQPPLPRFFEPLRPPRPPPPPPPRTP